MKHRFQKMMFRIAVSAAAAALLLAACGPAGNETGKQSPTEGRTTSAPVDTMPAEPSATTAVDTSETATQPSATTEAAAAGETPVSATGTAESSAATAAPQNATTFPAGGAYDWVQVGGPVEDPTDFQTPPDGSGRMFVLSQPGVIYILKDGAVLPEPFLDIRDRVRSSGNEQGLLGLAFHPDYASNGRFYLNYTGNEGRGDSVISRFMVSEANADQADPTSEEVLFKVQQPYENHNGGGMVFGPDGYLYISLGDGGSGGDPQGNGQNTNTLLGKILRIDVNTAGTEGRAYGIPADNPFAGGGGAPEIWAYGLRNPWRFSFDRATGDMYIADVGQNKWEEIHFREAGAPGGANYGWDFREGTHPFEGTPPEGAQLVDPVYEYDHALGCSVTGGHVYRGSMTEFRGIYVFGDFCSGYIWGLMRDGSGNWQAQQLFDTPFNLTAFGLDADGEMYLVDRGTGMVYRLQRKEASAFLYLPVVHATGAPVDAGLMGDRLRRLSG